MLLDTVRNFNYTKRIDPEVLRRRKKSNRGIGLWLMTVVSDLKRLLASRDGRDQAIEVYLRVPALILGSTPADIGEEVELTLKERMALRIVSLRPSDVPWRECRQIYKAERNRRKRERAAVLRLRSGSQPWAESLSRTKPWEAEGISRATWYRRRKPPRDKSVPPPSYEEGTGNFSLTEPKVPQKTRGLAMISALRPYQTQALADIRDTVRGGVRRLVVQAATGAGKTKIAAAIVDGAIKKDRPTAFVVPSIGLIDQTIEAFWHEGIRDVGVIQANHEMTDWSRPVQVCSIQTISRRGYPRADTVILDEVHQFHEAHRKWLSDASWEKVPFIGLSATPWTKGLGKYFQSLLIAATTKELIEQGYLSKFKVFAAGHPDLSEVKTVAGDYHEGQLSAAMQKGSLTADIVQTYKERWGQGKTLCFGVDKAHAKSIQERFEYAGIPCGYQDADTPTDERREIKRKFHNGEFQVVSNIQTLTTGVDWSVSCLILARPTRSEMLYVQIIGRALRTADGKDCAIILDHSDTTQRLGFVTDIHHDQLSNAAIVVASEAKPRLPKECPKCTALRAPGNPVCPNCGHETKIVSMISEGDGVLVELNGTGKVKEKKRIYSAEEKARFFSELKAIASKKGYSSGWSSQKFKAKFGTWPHHSFSGIMPAKIVSPDVALWVRAQNIRWAKMNQKPVIPPAVIAEAAMEAE